MPQETAGNIFAAYRERIACFIRKRVRLLEDAEDILQEVFYEYARMNSLTRPIRQTAAWLYRVARNKIINHWNKKKESALPEYYDEEGDMYVFADIADTLFGEAITPETENLRRLVAEEVQTALAELPEAQRTAFELSEFHGMAVKEIAAKTNVPVNTVLSRKHYAVKYLRKRLKELYADLIGE
ncbi:MAG: sigma-70 family RNA polymerase sigma factor [Spirochaetaceae bacterium]|jgi:RNA polymerase sigma factor (sigma-70 family)|nr:sigma-70 family RNA polymerase sigma factor [Spirochaetaceae bacterium]